MGVFSLNLVVRDVNILVRPVHPLPIVWTVGLHLKIGRLTLVVVRLVPFCLILLSVYRMVVTHPVLLVLGPVTAIHV